MLKTYDFEQSKKGVGEMFHDFIKYIEQQGIYFDRCSIWTEILVLETEKLEQDRKGS